MVDNKVQPDPIVRLYNNIKNEYDLPDFNTFKADMSDSNKAKRLHTTLINDGYEVPKFDVFSIDMGLKKKDGGIVSSPTKLPLQGFSEKQIGLLKKGVEKPISAPSQKKSSGLVLPTNLPKQEALAYENELKLNDAAANTLSDIYKKKGLKFDTSRPAAKKQIQEYVNKSINGDLTKVTGKDGKEYLVRSQGFFESAGDSFVRSLTDPIESTEINFTSSPEELANLLDEKIRKEPNIPEEAPSAVSGYLGGLAGGLPKLAAIAAIPYIGQTAMVGEMYYNALANQRRELYQRGLEEGMDRVSAAKKAMEIAPISAIPDALVAAVMVKGVSGKSASNVIPNAAKESFIKAASNALKSVGLVSATGGFAGYERSKIQQRAGYKVTDAEAIENGFREAGDYAIMDAAFKVAHIGPKYLSSAAKNVLSNVPKEVLNVVAEKYPDGQRTLDEIPKFVETKAKVQDFVPEEKLASVTGLTEKTDNIKSEIKDLEEKKKAVTPAIAKEIDLEIAEKNKEVDFYDNQIKKVIKSKDETGILEEIDNVTGLKAGEQITPKEVKFTEEVKPSQLPITKEIPEVTVEGTRRGYEVIEGNEANSIGDIRQEAAERRNNGEKFYVKETVKDGKKIFTLVDTTVFDEFGRPGFKSASVTVPENARLSSEALMGKMKDALGVTDKTSLEELNKITSKMKDAEVETTPTEVKVTEEFKDLSKSSEVELEKRLLEIEDSKSGTPERDEFNNIDKELEKREWRKVFDSPLDKVTEVADELIKKNEEQPSGFGSYIESWDARSLKLIANKYSKENVKKLTDSEIIKDYKDAMFGDPTSFYSDGLRLRESVKEAQNRGIDVFKELSKEFVKDGYSEQDAMNMAKRKLEPILKDLIQSSEKPLGLEQKPTEVKAEVKPTEIKEKFKPTSLEDEYNSKSVDELIALKKKLYPEPDIETPMTPEEKLLDRVIAKKFSEKNQEIIEKRKAAAEKVKPTEVKVKQEKTFAQKDLDRAEAKRIHSRVAEMEPPSDAEQVALRYLAEGGKVSQDAINEVSGTTKRASLNTGRRELKTEEAKARDYAGGKESLDDLAHRLWEASGQEISERDIKDALMSEIGNNNTRLDASKAYLERYNIEYQEEQYYERFIEEREEQHAKVQEELEKDLRKPLEEETEGMSSEEHINNLIKQYEAETKRENKQLGPEGKGEAVEEISSRDTGKKAPEEAELAKEYKEVVSKASKKAKENAKKEFVDRNFDNLVKKLKIQIKCPT